MIHLQRVRTKGAVPAAFRGPKRIEKALFLLHTNGGTRQFDSKHWKKAKKQLRQETGGKCAYCESPAATVAHCDVEHFRPKSSYWWLAYCYDNYLFSCQICNQSFKGDDFPLADSARRWAEPALALGASDAEKREFVRRFAPDPLDDAEGMAWTEFATECDAEGPLLADPYHVDPKDYLAWKADVVLKEVSVVAKDTATEPFLQAVETFYGLNREELRRARWRTFEVLDTFRQAMAEPSLEPGLRATIRTTMQHMLTNDAPYAGMCRYFVNDEWQLSL